MNTCLSTAGKEMPMRSFVFAALLVMTTGFVAAQSEGVELNPSHPEVYTVKKGDTLWDISNMFLKDPWYWPEIWSVNPQVKNPHLIYPGDNLKLVYIDGQPHVQLTRGSENRMSPRIREEALDEAITSIAYQDIHPFLTGGIIMDKGEIDDLPYVMALRDHMIAGAGHEVYVSGLPEDARVGTHYAILRVDENLRDPETGRKLGYEVEFVGTGELRRKGNPATLFLTKTTREAMRGDKVRVIDETLPMNFFPTAPVQEINGHIVAVVDGVSRIGQYMMVIINRGASDGVEAGTVLSVWQSGKEVQDYGRFGRKTTLPENRAGTLMVVKAYEDISYALVMEAESEMRVADAIRNP
jgi:hypothetical protein